MINEMHTMGDEPHLAEVLVDDPFLHPGDYLFRRFFLKLAAPPLGA